MENSKMVFTISLFYLFFFSCLGNSELTHINKRLDEDKSAFELALKKDSLMNHFPLKIEGFLYSISSPPGCPPRFQCLSQSGYVFLTARKSDYEDELVGLLNGGIEYTTLYNGNDNFLINPPELKHSFFPVPKCNVWQDSKLPIPYFENVDFGLGVVRDEKEIDGEKYYNSLYTIPSDLKVYVLSAENGDVWIEDCNEPRPSTLKEWVHGVSEGISVSEQENIITFWTIAW